MVLGRRVVILDQLRLRRSLAQLLGLPAGRRREEPHLALELDQLLIGVRLHFRLWNCFTRVSPERSSFTSAAAISLRSSCSICSVMRSNVSNTLLSPIEDMVSWMRLCASARFCRAIRMFFLRFASSIRSFSWRSDKIGRAHV